MTEKWSPSRHHFALTRLIARFMRSKPDHTVTVIYSVDRHQSAIENHTVAAWFTLSTACFIAAALPLVTPVALLVALPLSLLAIQLPIYVTGIPFNNPRVNAKFLMLCGAAAAAYFATQPGWVRFVAWSFLGVIALNAVAAIIVRLCER